MPTNDEKTTRAACGGEQHGLKWVREMFGLRPVWTVDPSIQCIKDICHQWIGESYPSNLCNVETKVEFLDEGAFNRVYRIDAIAKVETTSAAQLETGIVETHTFFRYAFRVSLPVDPQLKSLSEAATIQYLKTFAAIPTPTILHSVHSTKNALGFEWMLQTFIPGHKLSSIWNQLGYNGRMRMVQQLAEIQTTLFRKARFHQIGNIYCRGDQRRFHLQAQDDLAESSPNRFYVG